VLLQHPIDDKNAITDCSAKKEGRGGVSVPDRAARRLVQIVAQMRTRPAADEVKQFAAPAMMESLSKRSRKTGLRGPERMECYDISNTREEAVGVW